MMKFQNVKPITEIRRESANTADEWYRSLIESDADLEELKAAKLAQLNEACGVAITGYFTAEVRGETYEFSYDAEAQDNFQDTRFAFADGAVQTVRWTAHKDGQVVRIDMNANEFNQVYYAGLAHKQAQISRFRDELQPIVEAATTKEEVDAVNW
ncbi:hypothetical protein G3578_07335 [Brevibacillus sp. SYP-B805]|uniref:DUF4376 domain-containing protein n=1 Tax=Brevibacillus sp. SYP-B805 TaxID=1578199 RepID=UPI0013EBC834|nr:hypothetical protein [Brevibacillus sp. SYP-B805]NGQ94997.1 hypothetical protein [Brevibacillus sp. SYP-B805]